MLSLSGVCTHIYMRYIRASAEAETLSRIHKVRIIYTGDAGCAYRAAPDSPRLRDFSFSPILLCYIRFSEKLLKYTHIGLSTRLTRNSEGRRSRDIIFQNLFLCVDFWRKIRELRDFYNLFTIYAPSAKFPLYCLYSNMWNFFEVISN